MLSVKSSYSLAFLLGFVLLSQIGIFDDSFAQVEFDYGKNGFLFQKMLDAAKSEISELNNDENKMNLDIIGTTFETLTITIPISHEFHSIIDEAIILKNNNQFEESLAKYQLALEMYSDWYYSDDVDDDTFTPIEQDESELTESSVPKILVDELIKIKVGDNTSQTTQEESRGGCLIATATYGSELAP